MTLSDWVRVRPVCVCVCVCVCVFFPFSMLQLTLMAQVLSLQAPITMKVAAVAKFKVRVLAV